MEWVFLALASLFAAFGLACLVLVAVGLPGTWLWIGTAVAVELVDGILLGAGGPGAVVSFGWTPILWATAFGLLGEAIEFVSGAAGARLGGSTRRGMWGALIGGIAGALFGTPFLPVPLLGTLVGAFAGTFLGAWIGEATGPVARRRKDTLRAALAAVVGKLAGTLGKLATGIAAWLLLVRVAFA